MNTTIKNLLRLTLMALFGFLVFNLMCAVTMAQNSISNLPPVDGGDGGKPLEIFMKLKPIEFLLIPAVTVLIQLIRKWLPNMPNAAWPLAGPFIGALVDYAASKAGIWTGNPAIGVLFGGLATWFHQIDKNTVNIMGQLLPPSPPSSSA